MKHNPILTVIRTLLATTVILCHSSAMDIKVTNSIPEWLSHLNLPTNEITKIHGNINSRKTETVQNLKDQISFGVTTPPRGYFHESVLRKLRDLLAVSDQKINILDIGGGNGYVAADMALTLAKSPSNHGGMIYVSEPLLANTANTNIYNFLKECSVKNIKDLYTVTPLVFPDCRYKTKNTSGFFNHNKFNMIHCKNVLHFLLPSTADKFLKEIFDSLLPGGYTFLTANTPTHKLFSLSKNPQDCKKREEQYAPLIDGLNNRGIIPPIRSALEHYNDNFKREMRYPGSSLIIEFYTAIQTKYSLIVLNCCLTMYPELNKFPAEEWTHIDNVGEQIDDNRYRNMTISCVKSYKNFFTSPQLKQLAEEYKMTIIESGYLEGPEESKIPNDNWNGTPATAYIIVQKPL